MPLNRIEKRIDFFLKMRYHVVKMTAIKEIGMASLPAQTLFTPEEYITQEGTAQE